MGKTVAGETGTSEAGTWSIEELSRRAGVTTRTIRAYQTARLLPYPQRVGRAGRYGAGHLDRLAAIDRLQARGFSLAAIRELFAAWDRGESLADVLGLGVPSGDAAAEPGDWVEARFAGLPPGIDGWVEVAFTSLN